MMTMTMMTMMTMMSPRWCASSDHASDLASIKIMRRAGTAEIAPPKISTKMGTVRYAGHQARINEDGTVRARVVKYGIAQTGSVLLTFSRHPVCLLRMPSA